MGKVVYVVLPWVTSCHLVMNAQLPHSGLWPCKYKETFTLQRTQKARSVSQELLPLLSVQCTHFCCSSSWKVADMDPSRSPVLGCPVCPITLHAGTACPTGRAVWHSTGPRHVYSRAGSIMTMFLRRGDQGSRLLITYIEVNVDHDFMIKGARSSF